MFCPKKHLFADGCCKQGILLVFLLLHKIIIILFKRKSKSFFEFSKGIFQKYEKIFF